MSYALPPIVKTAERLLFEIEQAVRCFARYHKYSTGSTLREQAMKIAQLTHRAWRDRARQAQWLEGLASAIDDLRITMQLGSRLQAFRSFSQFEQLARTLSELGRQVGGWRKQQFPKGQNDQRSSAGQRAQTLSTRNASTYEANP
jgi:hypothetical protein